MFPIGDVFIKKLSPGYLKFKYHWPFFPLNLTTLRVWQTAEVFTLGGRDRARIGTPIYAFPQSSRVDSFSPSGAHSGQKRAQWMSGQTKDGPRGVCGDGGEVSSGGGLCNQLGNLVRECVAYRESGWERGSEFTTETDSFEEPPFKDPILAGIFLGQYKAKIVLDKSPSFSQSLQCGDLPTSDLWTFDPLAQWLEGYIYPRCLIELCDC